MHQGFKLSRAGIVSGNTVTPGRSENVTPAAPGAALQSLLYAEHLRLNGLAVLEGQGGVGLLHGLMSKAAGGAQAAVPAQVEHARRRAAAPSPLLVLHFGARQRSPRPACGDGQSAD